MKRLIALLLSVVLVLSLAACGKNPTETTNSSESTTAPTTGSTEKGPLYTKDSYTAADADVLAAREKVVATIGDVELTNGELQVYYWMGVYNFLSQYSYYASMFGLDYTQPLDGQDCAQNDGTWQHYFLEDAMNSWHSYQALALMGEEANIEIDSDLRADLDGMEETLKKSASTNGFDSVDAMIQSDMGGGCTFQDYHNYWEVYYMGYSYFNSMTEKYEITDAMIEEYFTEHESELAENGVTKESKLHNVRHILIEIEGGTKDEEGNTTYSDAEWEACRVKAQDLLDQWLAGEHTEETFADFAKEHSVDGGSSENGGLYEGLNEETNFVEEFKEWYLDESRQVGDYGLVKSTYGYHIMYYSGFDLSWISTCEDALLEEYASQIMTEAVEKHPMTVNYEDILLAEVDMSTTE